MAINKHTAWIKHYIMEEAMGEEWSKEWHEKYNLTYNEPQPKLERHRHDVYYRSHKNYYIWHISLPSIKLQWPIKITWNVIKRQR